MKVEISKEEAQLIINALSLKAKKIEELEADPILNFKAGMSPEEIRNVARKFDHIAVN